MVGRVAMISSGVGLLHSSTSISLKGTPVPLTRRFFNHWSYFTREKLCSWVAVNSNLKPLIFRNVHQFDKFFDLLLVLLLLRVKLYANHTFTSLLICLFTYLASFSVINPSGLHNILYSHTKSWGINQFL